MNKTFYKVDLWRKRGTNFLVEISHSNTDQDRNDRNLWAIYAYVYEKHPLFNKLPDIADSFPFHGGCTYKKIYINEDTLKPETIKVGCDYDHIYDDSYQESSCIEKCPSVMYDAQELFDYLERYQSDI